jgi:radical SAM protein with 4Fe4S-binding SPASM domain
MNTGTTMTENANTIEDTGNVLCGAAADIGWVDEFILRVKPFIFVRQEDCILIKRPNKAVKINPTGAAVLDALLKGTGIKILVRQLDNDPRKISDIMRFIIAVKQHLEGTLDPFAENPAIAHIPFDMKFSSYPVLSEIAVTYRCNLACKFCYAGCNCTRQSGGRADEMTASETKSIIDKIYHEAKVPSVSFTGGEPTLVPELPALIAYAKKTGMRVNLITNGTMIDKSYARKLADHGLDSAQVSMEGTEAVVHDRMVGAENAFEKTVNAVRHLKEQGVLTHTNTTVTRLNERNCRLLPAFVKKELGCDKFSMNLMIPVGSGAINNDIAVTYESVGTLIETMIDESRTQGVEFMWYSPVPLCMFNTIANGLGNKGCAACDGLISIAANGDIIPCASCDDSVGNLLHNDFKTLWELPKARKYRDKGFAHERCKTCSDFHICNGACPLYWRAMGHGELDRRLKTYAGQYCR